MRQVDRKRDTEEQLTARIMGVRSFSMMPVPSCWRITQSSGSVDTSMMRIMLRRLVRAYSFPTVSNPMPMILFITDNYEATEIWAHGLEQRGFETCVRGPEAPVSEISGIDKYDLILIDVYGLNFNALEATRLLRTEATSPILLFTYDHDERYHLDAYEIGVDECIAKPIGIPLFLAKTTVWSSQYNEHDKRVSPQPRHSYGHCSRRRYG
jgi:CheY-like chemotaxis protein